MKFVKAATGFVIGIGLGIVFFVLVIGVLAWASFEENQWPWKLGLWK